MEKLICYDNIKPIYTIDTDGNIKNINSGKYLKTAVTSAGYYTVGLQQTDSSRKIYYIHILVAETFLDKPDNAEQVNHKDKNRANNSVDNLEWCTQLENIYHQLTNTNTPQYGYKVDKWNKISKGEENGMSRITTEQCHFICKLLSEGYSRMDIVRACDFYITYDIVRFIHERKRWKHVSKYYKW